MIADEIAHWGALETWTLPSHLERQASERRDEPFLQKDNAAPLTYGEMFMRTRDMAARLSSLGVEFGDRVVNMVPNSIEAVLAWFGTNWLGAVDVPLNTGYVGHTIVHGVNLSEARVMVIHPSFLARVAEVEDELETLTTLVTTEPVERTVPFRRLRVVALDDVAPAPESQRREPTYRDVSSVVLTSGTTGPAKGAIITHAHAYSYAYLEVDGFEMTDRDVFLCVHPLFHVGGKGAITASLLAGGRVVMTDGFKPEMWIDDVRRYGATLTIGHGPMLQMVYAQPERDDDADTDLRAFMAAPFPTAIAEDFERRFGAKGVEVYGMTEVSTPTWQPMDEPLRLGSCGKPRDALFEVLVVDPESDMPVEPGEIGEITIRPKLPWILMQGYLSVPEDTVHAWRNFRFHTADAGYFDDDGYLYFTDRMKDRIRRRAENISSYEIEVAAGYFPGVKECAVVGVRSEYDADDDIMLFVVASQPLDFVALTEHLVRRLPHYMVPRYISQIEALPRTPTNKVRKQALRDLEKESSAWDRQAEGISVRALTEKVRGA